MSFRVILITGANGGLGHESATGADTAGRMIGSLPEGLSPPASAVGLHPMAEDRPVAYPSSDA